MFALGRFVANTGDRSDQANQIDFGVAVRLTQLALDGSPLVRKVGEKSEHYYLKSTCILLRHLK